MQQSFRFVKQYQVSAGYVFEDSGLKNVHCRSLDVLDLPSLADVCISNVLPALDAF